MHISNVYYSGGDIQRMTIGWWKFLTRVYDCSQANGLWCSWEPEQNVKKCERLIDSFWNHVGQDDEEHPVGYEFYAKTAWIEHEKDYFAREFAKHEMDQSDAKTRTPKNKVSKILTFSY